MCGIRFDNLFCLFILFGIDTATPCFTIFVGLRWKALLTRWKEIYSLASNNFEAHFHVISMDPGEFDWFNKRMYIWSILNLGFPVWNKYQSDCQMWTNEENMYEHTISEHAILDD